MRGGGVVGVGFDRRVKPGVETWDPVGVQKIPRRGITFKPGENPRDIYTKYTRKRTPSLLRFSSRRLRRLNGVQHLSPG